MEITIKYFGQLVDVTHKSEELLVVEPSTVATIIEELYHKYDELRNKDFQVAQNHELVSMDTKVTGAEIALLPPFSGG